jgi:AcrR family transcriptional regulator
VVRARQSADRSLDLGQVVSAAMWIIEERGARQLTMRAVGERLGVEAMSLYRYVPSRDTLLDAVVETVMDELYTDPDVHMITEPVDWQDYLVRLARGVRDIALRHPQVFPLVASQPTAAPWLRPPLRSLRWVDSLLSTLRTHGFSDAAAVAAYRGFSSFLLGHLLLEVAALGADVGPVASPDLAGASNGGHAEPAVLGGFPALQDLEPLLSQDHSKTEFQESLANLLERLDRLRSPGRG